jgi:Haem-binding domain
MFARRMAVSILFLSLTLVAGCSSGGANSTSAMTATSSTSEAVTSDARVNEMLETSCYDCHSDNSPAWNARFAPSYWFAGSARNDLNFSQWPSYDTNRKAAEARAIANTVSKGAMPPGDYTFFRPSAKLSAEDKDLLTQWASKEAAIAAH